jgi:hypothetical protein
MYRKAAEFWAELRLELLSASELIAEEKGNSNQIWRLYWASHQVLLPCVFKTSFYAILSPLHSFQTLYDPYFGRAKIRI